MNQLLNISIVVPVFNSAVCLEELVLRTGKVMHEMNKTFEIILVDDGSKDTSWEVIKQLKTKYPNTITGIKLAKNYGQQNATLCGIEHAQGDWVVTMDDDLEYPPEQIPNLFVKQQEGDFDVVYGAYSSKKQSMLRKGLTWSHKFITRVFNKKGNFYESSFRLLKSQIAKIILPHRQMFSIIDEFITWHTNQIISISVDCEKSKKRNSGYNIFKLYLLSKKLVFINTRSQLRLLTNLGFWIMIINLLIGVNIIYRKLILAIHVEGYTSLIVSILFSSGLMMYGLGVIAENISRLIKMNYRKPAYIERIVLDYKR